MSIVKEFKVTCHVCLIYRRFEADSEAEAKMRFRDAGWRFGGMGNPVWKCSSHPEIDTNVSDGREAAATRDPDVNES